MKNFEIVFGDNKKYWISRSIAATTIVTAMDKDENLKFLVVKRGSTVSNSNKWSLPGGFLDYDEDLPECAVREVLEETGLILSKDNLSFQYLHSAPTERQNVVAVYSANVEIPIEEIKLFPQEGEVSEIKWITIEEALSLDWAFDIYKEIVPIMKKIHEYVYLAF